MSKTQKLDGLLDCLAILGAMRLQDALDIVEILSRMKSLETLQVAIDPKWTFNAGKKTK